MAVSGKRYMFNFLKKLLNVFEVVLPFYIPTSGNIVPLPHILASIWYGQALSFRPF